MKVDRNLCMRCGGCVAVCPRLAINLTEHGISFDDKCNQCKICMHFCPMGAINDGDNKIKKDKGE